MVFSIVNKFNSNYVPTHAEAAILRKRMVEPEQRLRHLNTTISELQRRLAQLTDEKKLRDDKLRYLRAAIAPIRRLLPEILQEIFVHCLPSMHNSVMSRSEAPLLLGQVCSQWRRIAHGTPRLWASIHIVISRTPNSSPTKSCRFEQISSWLSRSGALPLSISIAFLGELYNVEIPNNPVARPYLDLLTPFAHRWRSIYLFIPGFDWLEFLDQYNASDVPLLERIHVEGAALAMGALGVSADGVPKEHTRLARDNNFFQAPQLRSLSIPYWAGIWRFPLRWGDLTGLCLAGKAAWRWEVGDIMKTLASCPNLETCFISLVNSYALAPPEEPDVAPSLTMNVYLPKLRSLSIEDNYDQTFPSSNLLKGLHAPNLRHLGYDKRTDPNVFWQNMWTPPMHILDAIAAFLGRLIHPLEELELILEPLSEAIGIGILEMLPELKRLSLRATSMGPDLTHVHLSTPWSIFDIILFRDRHLRRFTSRDDDGGGGGGGGSESDSDNDNDGSPNLPTTEWPHNSSSPSLPSLQPLLPLPPRSAAGRACLCPKLEVFHCTGAKFSNYAILNFLRSRSKSLRMVDITVTRNGGVSRKTRDSIQALEAGTGMFVNLACTPPFQSVPFTFPSNLGYSPYDGSHMAGVGS